jgi:hypothetical protein
VGVLTAILLWIYDKVVMPSGKPADAAAKVA